MKNIYVYYVKMYKLRDWVDESRLTKLLSINERAGEYLENHEHLINYDIFTNVHAMHIIEKRIQYAERISIINCNKNAVNFLRNNRQYVDYDILCSQEHGIEFIDELIKNNELDKIKWNELSRNPAAMHILNDPNYYNYIDWENILYNHNAVEFVKNNLHMVEDYWSVISAEDHLIDIIEQNMDKIDWNELSRNYNAIHILEKNMDKINIRNLQRNKYGFCLLLQLNHVFDDAKMYDKHIVLDYFDYCEKNNVPFNIIKHLSIYGYSVQHMDILRYNQYSSLSMNPNIFEYDYKRMRETRQSLIWYNDIKK